MGLVKFNNTTLNVDGLPDGAVVITGEQHSSFQQAQNAYTILKSKLPIGISEDQIATLTEKGQRYDTVNAELAQKNTKIAELTAQVDGFKNIPQGFTIEKWNQDRQREANETRQVQLADLTKKVADAIKKESPDRTLPKVDERFLPADKVKSFDPTSANAVDVWAGILAEGFRAQTEFAKSLGVDSITTPPLGGGSGIVTPPDNGGDTMPHIPRP